MFEVMITIAFRKSTLRPCESVSFPSSSTCRRMLNTSGCAFSISSSRTTEYGLRGPASPSREGSVAAPAPGGRAAPVVPEVPRRGADEPGHGVLLDVLRHVDLDHRAL